MHIVTLDLMQHKRSCNGSTMRKVTLKLTASKETGATDYMVYQLKVRIGSRAPRGRTVPPKLSPEATEHEILARTSRCRAFGKLLWRRNEGSSQRCTLLPHSIKSHTQNMKVDRLLQKSSQLFYSRYSLCVWLSYPLTNGCYDNKS